MLTVITACSCGSMQVSSKVVMNYNKLADVDETMSPVAELHLHSVSNVWVVQQRDRFVVPVQGVCSLHSFSSPSSDVSYI